MKYLLATSCLDTGGMDEVVFFLATRLARAGVTVAVLHASPEGGPGGAPTGRLGRQLLATGVETVQLGESSGTDWLRRWKPDVVSVHGVPMWVLCAARQFSIPCVETLHGMHSLFDANPASVAERGRLLTAIVAVSELLRQQYLTVNPGFPADRVLTIPNGVDDCHRTPPDRHAARTRWGIESEYIFLCLARHSLQKNTYGLVVAFDDVATRHPEAHLLIAGAADDPVYLAQILRLRASLRARERIHLRNYSPKPAELLALADGFVLDSFLKAGPLHRWRHSTQVYQWCSATSAAPVSRSGTVENVDTSSAILLVILFR
ncbi:glycosyltransferase family 4 protein [Tunturiibacter gelidiferens]